MFQENTQSSKLTEGKVKTNQAEAPIREQQKNGDVPMKKEDQPTSKKDQKSKVMTNK
jgi:hypothetical protein